MKKSQFPKSRLPEVVVLPSSQSSGDIEKSLATLRRIAMAMDRLASIPGTKIGIGLDGILGLVPGLGDALTGLVSSYIVYKAYHLGARPLLLTRLCFNVVIDSLIGVVPLIGDIFDVMWKANMKNVALLEDAFEKGLLRGAPHSEAVKLYSFAAAVLVLLLVIVLPVYFVFFLIRIL